MRLLKTWGMWKIKLVVVGGLKEGWLRQGLAEYEKRLRGLGVELEWFEVGEGRGDKEKIKREEGEKILEKVEEPWVVFDVGGEGLGSCELALGLEKLVGKSGRLCMVVGGSEGLDERVKGGAKVVWSLGRVTFPHQLFRVILVEQIYRAVTILSGKRYHK